MIQLTPPYHVINGITFLPDHADPGLFHALPAAPDLALTSEGKPAFSLVQYLGGGPGQAKLEGGLLTMTTQLSIDEAALDEAQSALAEKLGRSGRRGTLRLQPVLFDRGSVELIALGNPSQLGTSEGESDESGPALENHSANAAFGTSSLVVHTLGSGKPSLGGRNEATFQLVLGATEAELIERCLESADLPIIVIYRLSVPALRPSFGVRVEADWHRVYSSLQNRLNANVYVAAADVEAAIAQSLEESDIRIETQVFGTGEEARIAADRARRQLTEWVLERLFTPVADPTAEIRDIGRTVEDTVWSLVRSIVPGVSYKLKVLNEQQIRSLSARMDEAVAERIEVIPQGVIGALFERFRFDEKGRFNPQWPSVVERLVHKVNLDGFPRLEVEVGVEDRFDTDGIREVIVDMARPSDTSEGGLSHHRTFAFRNSNDRANYIVNLLGEDPVRFSDMYRYRYRVAFDSTGPFGAHETVTSPWKSAQTPQLFIEPRELYTVRKIDVVASPTFSFDTFPQITVQLRYPVEGDDQHQVARIQLTSDNPAGIWHFRSFAGEASVFEYRITYHRAAAQGGNIESPWRRHADDWLNVPDPLPIKRTLNLFVNLPWPEVVVAFVQIRYRDDTNGVRFDEQINLDPTTAFLRRDYPIAANGPATLSYRLSMLMTDGRLLEGSWRETDDERLVIDATSVERRLVQVRALGNEFEAHQLKEVRLALEVRDPESGAVRDETEIRMSDTTELMAQWEYLLGDPPQRTVHYRATFIDRNGFLSTGPWLSTTANLIVVDVRNRRVLA